MNLKTSPFAIQDKKLRDLDLANEYPTLKDLMKEQGVSTDLADYWDRYVNLIHQTQVVWSTKIRNSLSIAGKLDLFLNYPKVHINSTFS